MASTPVLHSDAFSVLQQLLCGQDAAADQVANALRVDAHGCTTFGRTDALDLFANHPLVLSDSAQVLLSPAAIALFDEQPDGRTVGVFADLNDGVITRVWVIAATVAGATVEPAVPVARDDFMSQLRERCQGDAADHPNVESDAWLQVVALGKEALQAVHQPMAASSSQAWVVRAFSSGESVVALYRLRVQAAALPRQAHDRFALVGAVARVHDPEGDGGLSLSPSLNQQQEQQLEQQPRPRHRLALSDPLPQPEPVLF